MREPEAAGVIDSKFSDCTASAAPALSADWLTGTGNPQLRGAL